MDPRREAGFGLYQWQTECIEGRAPNLFHEVNNNNLAKIYTVNFVIYRCTFNKHAPYKLASFRGNNARQYLQKQRLGRTGGLAGLAGLGRLLEVDSHHTST